MRVRAVWLAVPGGYLNANEGIHDGIIRELIEETKLNVPGIRNLIEEVATFDNPDRDQRGRLITFNGFIDLGALPKLPEVYGSDDASNAKWYNIHDLSSGLFYADHYDMMRHMLARY
jgi:bifunctional NMN adenylyltransferase/nudix hydrolase